MAAFPDELMVGRVHALRAEQALETGQPSSSANAFDVARQIVTRLHVCPPSRVMNSRPALTTTPWVGVVNPRSTIAPDANVSSRVHDEPPLNVTTSTVPEPRVPTTATVIVLAAAAAWPGHSRTADRSAALAPFVA
jgi:hypothetical protein